MTNGWRAGRRAGGRATWWSILSSLPILPFLPLASQEPPPLPGAPHVLALARAPDSALWAGTYGEGIFVLDRGAAAWRQLRPDTTGASISWGFVHAFAFTPDGAVWYGTVGNGWGRSTDGGRTWRNWTFGDLGPEYQYVAPNGIVVRGDTVHVATADGVKVSPDGGTTWRVVTDSMGARSAKDPVLGLIRNQYVLAIAAGPDGAMWLSHLHGVEHSADGGRTWRYAAVPGTRVRAILPLEANMALLGTETGMLVARLGSGALEVTAGPAVPGAVQTLARDENGVVAVGTSDGMFLLDHGAVRGPLDHSPEPRTRFVATALSLGRGRWLTGGPEAVWVTTQDSGVVAEAANGTPVAEPAAPRHTWFARPVTDQPYIDQTYRYGSTMGGNFQQHQGVEFNAGEGTVVRAIGDGVVAFAGPGEAGALTVAIRHDRRLEADGRAQYVFSAYYHGSSLLVAEGDRVRAGDPIARVGNTGRATNDHLHLEVHVMPTDSVRLVVDPAVRYPPYSSNPELWIAPLPGTGIVAGRVVDSTGAPVPQARVVGLAKPEPQETPHAFAETYGDRARGTPAYMEHFAIGDVPAGTYTLSVMIAGRRVTRRARVAPGRVTWVEFRP